MKHVVYLSLGSNLGDREGYLRSALSDLGGAGLKVTRVSAFRETDPVDVLDQPRFLNCAVAAETELAPVDVLHALQGIESRLGRVRTIPRGPRTIDLDLLFYDDAVIATPDLVIPHPRLGARRFVLEPLAEFAPDLRHPVTGMVVREMLEGLPS